MLFNGKLTISMDMFNFNSNLLTSPESITPDQFCVLVKLMEFYNYITSMLIRAAGYFVDMQSKIGRYYHLDQRVSYIGGW